jgi:hypothetical protein
MAPMITAVEFTFKPMDAIKMEKMRIHAVGPLKPISRFIPAIVDSMSVPSVIFRIERKNLRVAIIKWSNSFFLFILHQLNPRVKYRKKEIKNNFFAYKDKILYG